MADVHAVVNRSTPSNSPLSTVSLFIVSTTIHSLVSLFKSEMKRSPLHITWTLGRTKRQVCRLSTGAQVCIYLMRASFELNACWPISRGSVRAKIPFKICFNISIRSRSNLGRISRMASNKSRRNKIIVSCCSIYRVVHLRQFRDTNTSFFSFLRQYV